MQVSLVEGGISFSRVLNSPLIPSCRLLSIKEYYSHVTSTCAFYNVLTCCAEGVQIIFSFRSSPPSSFHFGLFLHMWHRVNGITFRACCLHLHSWVAVWFRSTFTIFPRFFQRHEIVVFLRLRRTKSRTEFLAMANKAYQSELALVDANYCSKV